MHPEALVQAILDGEIDSFTDVAESSGPFTYFHKGSLAYLGGPCVGVGFRVLGFRVQGFLAQNLCGRRLPKQHASELAALPFTKGFWTRVDKKSLYTLYKPPGKPAPKPQIQ